MQKGLNMSARNLDKHQRFRCVSVCFRVSPEESDELNRAVKLSGLNKYEYCYRKCMDRKITVNGNPKVYKALKDELKNVLNELKRIDDINSLTPEWCETLNLITVTLNGMKGEINE